MKVKISESPKKPEKVDFKLLHNFIDDLHLNFNNTTRENIDVDAQVDSVVDQTEKNKSPNEPPEELLPLIHEKNVDKMMSASLYPQSLSRSYELELFKKYLGRAKQEKVKQNIREERNGLIPTVQINPKEPSSKKRNILYTKKHKTKPINTASKVSSFERNLNKELGRFSIYYGKEQSLERFLIKQSVNEAFEHNDNIIAYTNKKINLNNEGYLEKKIKLKPLIFKNSSSVERLAKGMFNYSKKMYLKNKIEQI